MNASIGHNSQDISIEVEVRLFNSVVKYANCQGNVFRLTVPAGATVAEVAERVGVPCQELFLVLVNGRDITPGIVGDAVKSYHVIEDGDVIALSGAVPYSYGYGAPVV